MVDLEECLGKITTYKTYSKGYLCRCPFASKTHAKGYDRSPSLAVWPEINFFGCYSCGVRGEIRDLFVKLAELIPTDLHKELSLKWQDSLWHIRHRLIERPESERVYLSEEILEHFPKVYGEGKDYLIHQRKVDESAIEEYDIRWDDRSRRVVFPVRDKTGLLGLVGRDIDRKGHFKYFLESNSVLCGEDKLKNERIAVVEGFLDILKVWPMANQLGIDLVCCGTASLSHKHVEILAERDAFVYLMLDQDDAGNKGATKFAKVYPGLSTRLVWDFKNEKGEIADVGDMTSEQFRSFFNV